MASGRADPRSLRCWILSAFLMNGLDAGLIGSLTTADTSKAFDNVRHPRLLEKLGWYGIDANWIEDWLTGRYQTLKTISKNVKKVSRFINQCAV